VLVPATVGAFQSAERDRVAAGGRRSAAHLEGGAVAAMPLETPAAVLPSCLNVRPGGTLPPMVQEPAADWAPVTVKATVRSVPTVALAGLGVDGLSTVAPASVLHRTEGAEHRRCGLEHGAQR